MDKSIKILVSIKDIKSEAKRIKKENKENTIPYTKILDILITNLGYMHYNEYEYNLKHSSHDFKIKSISNLSFNHLINLKNSIISNFEEFDIKIDKLHFVDKSLNYIMSSMMKHKPYSMSVYLSVLPDLLLLTNNNIMNLNTWKIDKTNFEYCVKKLIKKYSKTVDLSRFESPLFNTDDFDEYLNFFEIYKFSLQTKIISNISEKAIENFCDNLKNNSFREFSIAINNLKYELYDIEGLFFNKLNDLNNKLITVDELYDFAQKVIKKEREFLESYTLPYYEDISEVEFKTPITLPNFKEIITSKNSRLIEDIKNETDVNNPVCVGTTRKETLFNINKNYLTLSKKEYMNNILISGSVGSGKTIVGISFLFQSLLNNRGAIYIDEYDNQSYHLINSLAKECNREKDILFFNANQYEFILKTNLSKLLSQNKIIIISLPYLDSMRMRTEYSAVTNHVFNQIKKYKNNKKHYFPNSIFINNFEALTESDIKELFEIIPVANNKNINFIIISQSFYNNSFQNSIYSDLMTLCSNTLVMKQEYTLISNYMNNQIKINSNSFRALNAGKFYFAKNGTLDTDKIYSALYADAYNPNQHLTINYPYFKV